ncbi:HPF/RaiA family ribosome-associated protein [Qaidamihabitans albus]|uniref:HPF/RaiA family ribosome-associated protein n=1 Tax=Qaidamihabitans albus TaxID=2795733 RepID=UPI0018F1E3C3|nr:HPF/RaiA family ribosome-associated protein [Qaidamihabitans albus]
MRIQVNTDDNIDGDDALLRQVEAEISSTLSRFSEQVTRVEVHLGDENADRAGSTDKRCVLEARPAGRRPVAVTHHAPTIDEACHGATQKLKHLLESSFGRREDRKGHASIRGGQQH